MCSLVRLTSCSTSEMTLWEVYVMVSSSRRDIIFSHQKRPMLYITFTLSHFSLPSWMIVPPEIVQYMYVYVLSYSPFSCSIIFVIIWRTKLSRHSVSFWQFWDNYPLHSFYELNVWLHLACILFLIEWLTAVWFKVLLIIVFQELVVSWKSLEINSASANKEVKNQVSHESYCFIVSKSFTMYVIEL